MYSLRVKLDVAVAMAGSVLAGCGAVVLSSSLLMKDASYRDPVTIMIGLGVLFMVLGLIRGVRNLAFSGNKQALGIIRSEGHFTTQVPQAFISPRSLAPDT